MSRLTKESIQKSSAKRFLHYNYIYLQELLLLLPSASHLTKQQHFPVPDLYQEDGLHQRQLPEIQSGESNSNTK